MRAPTRLAHTHASMSCAHPRYTGTLYEYRVPGHSIQIECPAEWNARNTVEPREWQHCCTTWQCSTRHCGQAPCHCSSFRCSMRCQGRCFSRRLKVAEQLQDVAFSKSAREVIEGIEGTSWFNSRIIKTIPVNLQVLFLRCRPKQSDQPTKGDPQSPYIYELCLVASIFSVCKVFSSILRLRCLPGLLVLLNAFHHVQDRFVTLFRRLFRRLVCSDHVQHLK